MLNNLSFPVIAFVSPGAVAFHIGFWPVRWYGIFVACGFLAVYFLAERLIIHNWKGEVTSPLQHFHDMIFFMLIFSIVFARLWFVFLSWDYFKNHLSEIPKTWHGGQSVHGGMFGGIFVALIYSKLKKISFFKYMDVIAVVAPLGQAIGRWGNFFNNEAFGKPVETGLPCLYNMFRLYIPPELRPEKYLQSEFFHPTFLYESILDFFIFIFLYKKYFAWKEKKGKTFWMYLLCYSIIRFFLEFIRVDSLCLFDHFASAHVVSVIIIVISLYFLSRR